MRLEEIHLKNFGPYHDITLRLSNVAAAVVLGQNGAGKSILFIDAVRAALFGRARSPMDDMIRTGETDMMIVVTFMLNTNRYRVIRKRSVKTKSGKTELALQMQGPESIDWNDISGARVVDTQDKIYKLLNCDDDLLTATAFFVQGQADRFSRATPGERKTILAAILRLDHYATLKQEAARRATRAEDQVAIRTDRLNDLDAAHRELEDLIKARVECEELNQRERILGQRLEEGRDQLLAKLSELQAQHTQEQTLQTALGRTMSSLLTARSREASAHARHASTVEQLKGREAIEVAVKEKTQHETLQLQINESRKAVLQRQRNLEAERIRREQRAAEADQLQSRALQNGQRRLSIESRKTRLLQILNNEQAITKAVEDAETLKSDVADLEGEIQKSHTLEHQADTDGAAAFALITERSTLQNELNPIRIKLAEAAHEYRQNTKALEQTLEQAREAVGLLKQVPCDAGLQAKCQFTINAVETRGQIPILEDTLGRRLKQQDLIFAEVLPEQHAREIELRGALDELELKKPDEALAVAQQRKRNMQAVRGDLMKELERRKAQLKATEALVAQAGELKLARTELKSVEADLQACTAEIEEIVAKAATLKPDEDSDRGLRWELEQLTQTLAAMESNEAERRERIQTLTEMIIRKTEQISAATRELPVVEKELATCIEERQRLEQIEKEQLAELENAKQAKEEWTRIQELLGSTSEQIAANQETLRSIAGRLGDLNSRIGTVTRTVDEGRALQEEVEQLRLDTRHYRVLEEAYAMIPTLVMENAIPALEEETNRLLERISRTGMRVRIDTQKALKSKEGLAETLDIAVRDQIGERPIDNYSGGERFRLDLAMRIGLSKLLARRAGASIQTLAIDEGLGSLDEDGLEQLRECLGVIGDEFDLILVITHVEGMKSTFPSQIVITKDPERGSLVEVLA